VTPFSSTNLTAFLDFFVWPVVPVEAGLFFAGSVGSIIEIALKL